MRKRKIENDIGRIITSLKEIYDFYGLDNSEVLWDIITKLRSLMYSKVIDEEINHE